MMTTGTVKSFNPAKGYGFIKTDTVGADVFVHLSAVRQEDESHHDLGLANIGPEIVRCNVSQKNMEQPIKKRKWIARAALESALAENVRGSDPQCEGLIEIIVERVVPVSPDGANWAVKGVKYGKAEREACNAAIPKVVEECQREFEVSDWP